MYSLFDNVTDCNGLVEGKRRRDEALARLREHRAAIIRKLQYAAIRVALETGKVCADDVRALVAIPPGMSPKVVGPAFRELVADGLLRYDSSRLSKRPAAHARTIKVWRLADSAAASAFLNSHLFPLIDHDTRNAGVTSGNPDNAGSYFR